MPPKKAKKMGLNEFLGDSSLGSWADEMDALPTAPAPRSEEDHGRPGRRGEDFLASRPDRAPPPPRDDAPLPTQPPYTAFIGNLAFDLIESELEEFFAPAKAKSVKIIRDKEDKPKGFGYIEFEELDGLKQALAKSGTNFSGRTVRVSVAEPPKERDRPFGSGAHGHHEDDAKFDSPWRRDGPLPPLLSDRERRPGAPVMERLPSTAEGVADWRSNRPARSAFPEPEPPLRRAGSGFLMSDPGAADTADTWTRGAKFVPPAPAASGGGEEKFGSVRRSGPSRERDGGSPSAVDESDWRRSRTQSNVSPGSSNPPTPQMGRRKLELLPRSGAGSVSPSPLSSPRLAPTMSASASRASPFGAARPVDITSREKEVIERHDKEREVSKDRLSMSRTNSRSGFERSPLISTRTPPPPSVSGGGSEREKEKPVNGGAPKLSLTPSVRPSLSFASAAKSAGSSAKRNEEVGEEKNGDVEVGKIADEVAEVVL